MAQANTEKQVRSRGTPHVGHADSVTNDEHGSHSDISDKDSSKPVTRVIKVTLPNPPTLFFKCMIIHSFIHSHTRIHTFIHTSHSFIPYIRSIAYAIDASQRFVLRHKAVVASFYMSKRPTGVRRLAREGLEATSRQTEPREKMQMSPSGPRPICPKADRVILTFSLDPNLEPCPQNLHRGEASEPPELVSGITWASSRRRVKE